MKSSNSVGSFILFAIAFLPINAYSEAIPERGPIPFSAYDKDGDDLISKKEFNEIRADRLSKRATEGTPMRGAANAPSFSAFDTNKDGQLTQGEFTAGQKIQMEKRRNIGAGQGRGMGQEMGMGKKMPEFSTYDVNGDGKILEKEFNEARAKRISEKTQQGYQMKNLGSAPLFIDIDADNDGKISPEEPVYDPRTLVDMPEKAKNIMRKDMQSNLAALNTIISYLASNEFESAGELAEKVMGKSTMGKHRESGSAPGRFMTNEMKNLGWGMHEAASEFAEVAKQGDIKSSLESLEKLTSSCVACHYTYRIR